MKIFKTFQHHVSPFSISFFLLLDILALSLTSQVIIEEWFERAHKREGKNYGAGNTPSGDQALKYIKMPLFLEYFAVCFLSGLASRWSANEDFA